MRREGEEFVHCLNRRFTFKIEGKTYRLGEGDSIYFRAHLRHKWRNTEPHKAKVLWIYIP
jgi:quercetin dioxygenase-like cupin family protein